MAKSKTTAGKTLVTLLLDRSGSMAQVHAPTVTAINAWLDELRGGGQDIRFSLVQFDHYAGEMALEKTCVAKRIADVEPMKLQDFSPRGGTPLIDAAFETITAVERSLGDRDCKVVIAIQTDGDENQSRRRWTELRDLIARKEANGWQFIFMGCGIDAYAQGSLMGISADKTLSYGMDAETTRLAFRASASNTVAYSANLKADMGYTRDQKRAAGDSYAG